MGLQGLQGVTEGYRLQGVTWGYRGYKRLQRVTEGNKGLQGVASGYTGLQ